MRVYPVVTAPKVPELRIPRWVVVQGHLPLDKVIASNIVSSIARMNKLHFSYPVYVEGHTWATNLGRYDSSNELQVKYQVTFTWYI